MCTMLYTWIWTIHNASDACSRWSVNQVFISSIGLIYVDWSEWDVLRVMVFGRDNDKNMLLLKQCASFLKIMLFHREEWIAHVSGNRLWSIIPLHRCICDFILYLGGEDCRLILIWVGINRIPFYFKAGSLGEIESPSSAYPVWN